MRFALALTAALAITCSVAFAGGELPDQKQRVQTDKPAPVKKEKQRPFYNTIEKKKIGPIMGNPIQKDAPLPAPQRSMGWGYNCQEFYGPTYYYPWYHNVYEGLNPSYYPFYHPRLWPNYKTDALYCPGTNCGSSRSKHYWDSYDDYMRGGRYDENQ